MINCSKENRSLKKRVAKQARQLKGYVKALKQRVTCVGERLWRQVMVTMASFCAAFADTFRTAMPYQLLRQTLSKEEDITVCDDHHHHHPLENCGESTKIPTSSARVGGDESNDMLVLKVAILGDSGTGKTSFVESYIGISKGSDQHAQAIAMAPMEKTVTIQNTQIVFSLWELGGYNQDMLPEICRDAVALLFTFDLTQRSTLHSIKQWFLQARLHNKNAISILIGTKYDQFVKFPYDIQLAILQQAMHYSQTMGASLFFSSVTHNINVQKIFKVILSKIFDLPCNIPKNHNFGEPIVDY